MKPEAQLPVNTVDAARDRPARDIDVVSAPTCYMCGRVGLPLYAGMRDRHFGTPHTWSVRECANCGLAWLDPCPAPHDMAKLYAGCDYYTHVPLTGGREVAETGINGIRGALLATGWNYGDLPTRMWQRTAARLLGTVAPVHDLVGASVMWLSADARGRLLDLGCGSGEFLARMRACGWQVSGVEPDPQAVLVARKTYGLDVTCGTLEQAAFPDATFDAITVCHVVEHVWDPVTLLSECRRILKPGGQLILVTPNVESLGRRLFGEAWLFWDVPRHVRLFTSKTLVQCAQRAGLRVNQARSSARRASYGWLCSRIIGRRGILPGLIPDRPSLRLRLEGRVFWLLEALLALARPVGEELVVTSTRDG